MVREWRSRNLVHESTSHLNGERDLLLRNKDDEGRSETNDGEARALVFWERSRASLEMGYHPFSVLFWFVTSGHSHL